MEEKAVQLPLRTKLCTALELQIIQIQITKIRWFNTQRIKKYRESY
jgi:hypothetical protein